MRLIEHPRVRTWYLVLSLLVLFGGDAWRYSMGWVAWGAIAATLAAISVMVLVHYRDRWSFGGLPYPLIVFMFLTTVSVTWSYYPASTTLGLLTTWLTVLGALALAISFDWGEILNGLARVLRILISVSLIFEFIVSVFIRVPILPWTTQPEVAVPGYDETPLMLYWSRNELFETFGDGRIQGVVGNANHLGFLALLALIVFSIQWATRNAGQRWSFVWIALSILTVYLTRSATVVVALVAVGFVALGLFVIRSRASEHSRQKVAFGVVAIVGFGIAIGLIFRETVLSVLGRSSDLTGRTEIWQLVASLAEQRPVFGWGWISFWMPETEPFANLAVRNGVLQLQAHNAWLDVWLQLGFVGVVVFSALILSTLTRAWQAAVDRPHIAPDQQAPFSALTLLPILVLIALLVQSLPESRLLGEYALAMLVIIAVKTKRPDWARIGL